MRGQTASGHQQVQKGALKRAVGSQAVDLQRSGQLRAPEERLEGAPMGFVRTPVHLRLGSRGGTLQDKHNEGGSLP